MKDRSIHDAQIFLDKWQIARQALCDSFVRHAMPKRMQLSHNNIGEQRVSIEYEEVQILSQFKFWEELS